MTDKKKTKVAGVIVGMEIGLLDLLERMPLSKLGKLGQKIEKASTLVKKHTDKKFGVKLRNAEEFKLFVKKEWLHQLPSFPEQENENTTLLIVGSADYRSLAKFDGNTDFIIAYNAGGITSFTGCGISQKGVSGAINEEISRILNGHPEIDKVFLISSYPFPAFLKLGLGDPEYWEIRNCVIWLAQAQNFIAGLNSTKKVESFLIYDKNLCLVNCERVLKEKLKYRNVGIVETEKK